MLSWQRYSHCHNPFPFQPNNLALHSAAHKPTNKLKSNFCCRHHQHELANAKHKSTSNSHSRIAKQSHTQGWGTTLRCWKGGRDMRCNKTKGGDSNGKKKSHTQQYNQLTTQQKDNQHFVDQKQKNRQWQCQIGQKAHPHNLVCKWNKKVTKK